MENYKPHVSGNPTEKLKAPNLNNKKHKRKTNSFNHPVAKYQANMWRNV